MPQFKNPVFFPCHVGLIESDADSSFYYVIKI